MQHNDHNKVVLICSFKWLVPHKMLSNILLIMLTLYLN